MSSSVWSYCLSSYGGRHTGASGAKPRLGSDGGDPKRNEEGLQATTTRGEMTAGAAAAAAAATTTAPLPLRLYLVTIDDLPGHRPFPQHNLLRRSDRLSVSSVSFGTRYSPCPPSPPPLALTGWQCGRPTRDRGGGGGGGGGDDDDEDEGGRGAEGGRAVG